MKITQCKLKIWNSLGYIVLPIERHPFSNPIGYLFAGTHFFNK